MRAVLLVALAVAIGSPLVACAQPKGKAEPTKKSDLKELTKEEKAAGAAGGFVCMGIGGLALLLCAVAVLVAYLIPSIIALMRGHPNAAPVVAVNLLLGWTIIGWVVALAWALTAFEPRRSRTQSPRDDNPFE